MKHSVNCLCCEASIELPEWLHTDDYKGEILCNNCKARLWLKFKNSVRREYKVIKEGSATPRITKITHVYSSKQEKKVS